MPRHMWRQAAPYPGAVEDDEEDATWPDGLVVNGKDPYTARRAASKAALGVRRADEAARSLGDGRRRHEVSAADIAARQRAKEAAEMADRLASGE